jgi:hypothetical protein
MTNTFIQWAQKWHLTEKNTRVVATSVWLSNKGLISLAMLLSILDQAKIFSSPNKKVANAIRILPLHDPDQYKAAFILQRPF